MKTLTDLNIKLNDMTSNKALVDTTRATIVNEIVSLIVAESKGHEFTNKRIAQKWIIEELLSDDNKNLDNYTKRAIKVAKAILVNGYKIKKELLTIAQAENLVKCDKAVVNALMSEEGEEYTEDAKAQIKELDKLKAMSVLKDLDALGEIERLKDAYGEDVRKVLNNLLKVI